MARNIRNTEDRIATIRAAWKELGPLAVLAGRTLEQFETETETPLRLRAEILALDKQLEGRKADRTLADEAANGLMDLVVNSVRGTPVFGPDAPLYRAMGYIRKCELRSGLKRKGQLLKKAPVVKLFDWSFLTAIQSDQRHLGANNGHQPFGAGGFFCWIRHSPKWE